MADEQDEVVRSLFELLAIAKVAMPSYLFDIDPRVHRARQLIAKRVQVTGDRPPSVLPISATMVDVGTSPSAADLERMHGAAPPWDISEGLDAFMETDLAPETRTEAVVLILREWLTAEGHIVPGDEGQH